ncbi:MAG TPA: hypothetical protein VFC99_13685 [Acidimicrobiia bacterium]|nr:hypothetical protein [Acidimicrobiia bacterium]
MPLQILLREPATNLTFPELDPPEHRMRRRVLAPAYTREAARHDDATIRAITRQVLGPLVERGTFDAFGDYAHVVAGRFAATKAGVPLADADALRTDISRAFRREPGQRGTSPANQEAMLAVFTYLHQLVADGRRRPDHATGWGSANRDEAEFPAADRFDLHRRPKRSLVFGHGQHQCIGEHVGMRMGTAILEELVAAIDDYEVDADGVHRRYGEFLKGYDRLPISVTPRTRTGTRGRNP